MSMSLSLSPSVLLSTGCAPAMPATLGDAPRGYSGRIRGLRTEGVSTSLTPRELERRLLELGFVEGASVEVLHQGLFRRDPIAVRVGGATFALRRAEARAIQLDAEARAIQLDAEARATRLDQEG